MKVNNINGTSDYKCNCASWLAHWEKFSGLSIDYCPAKGCLEKELVGAHVQKDSDTDKSWYIIPLCRKHNGETGKSLTVSNSCTLVSANVNNTCGSK